MMFISQEIQRLFYAKFGGYTTMETAFNVLSTKKNVFFLSSSNDLRDNDDCYTNSDASKRSMGEICFLHQESAKMERISIESMFFVQCIEHSRIIEKSFNRRNLEYSMKNDVEKSLNWKNLEYSIPTMIENETQKSSIRRNFKYSRSNEFQCVSLRVWSELSVVLDERVYSCIADINLATEACNMTKMVLEDSNSHREIQIPYSLEFCICHIVSICVQKAKKYIRGASSILVNLLNLAMENQFRIMLSNPVLLLQLTTFIFNKKGGKNNVFELVVYKISDGLKVNGIAWHMCITRNVISFTKLLDELLSVLMANRNCDVGHGICEFKQKLSTIRGKCTKYTFEVMLTCYVRRNFVFAGQSIKLEPLHTMELFNALVRLTLANCGFVYELFWIYIAMNEFRMALDLVAVKVLVVKIVLYFLIRLALKRMINQRIKLLC